MNTDNFQSFMPEDYPLKIFASYLKCSRSFAKYHNIKEPTPESH